MPSIRSEFTRLTLTTYRTGTLVPEIVPCARANDDDDLHPSPGRLAPSSNVMTRTLESEGSEHCFPRAPRAGRGSARRLEARIGRRSWWDVEVVNPAAVRLKKPIRINASRHRPFFHQRPLDVADRSLRR